MWVVPRTIHSSSSGNDAAATTRRPTPRVGVQDYAHMDGAIARSSWAQGYPWGTPEMDARAALEETGGTAQAPGHASRSSGCDVALLANATRCAGRAIGMFS